MFYAPEILSQKNKTEISLVYYISTIKTIKKQYKKEIIDVDFDTVFEKIENPKTPFALRLYSYLLNGIIKMWMIKVEYYKHQVKNLLSVKKRTVGFNKKQNTESNVNLRIVDRYISEIEDCSTSCNQNFNLVDSVEELTNFNKEGFDSLDNCYFDDAVEFEHADRIMPMKRVKRNQIDKVITLDSNEIYTSKIYCTKVELPKLVNNELTLKFSNFISALTKKPIETENFAFENDISIEDPRISSSASQEKNIFKTSSSEYEDQNFKLTETRALSFYNILVEASQGLIKVSQKRPFEAIEISTSTGIIYFN